jgi:hypothetical protein
MSSTGSLKFFINRFIGVLSHVLQRHLVDIYVISKLLKIKLLKLKMRQLVLRVGTLCNGKSI